MRGRLEGEKERDDPRAWDGVGEEIAFGADVGELLKRNGRDRVRIGTDLVNPSLRSFART